MLREALRLIARKVEARFGELGLRYLEVATETPPDQAAALGLSITQLYKLRERILAYCAEIRRKNGMSGPILAGGMPFLDDELDDDSPVDPESEEVILDAIEHLLRVAAARAPGLGCYSRLNAP